MWFVYVLKSIDYPFIYIGSTKDPDKRLREHHEGMTQSTKHYAPVEINAYVAVATKAKAKEVEKYFKAGSGKAVLKKRFLSLTGGVKSDHQTKL